MLRTIIAEIDKVAKDLEDFDNLWAFNMVWKLDKIAQELEEIQNKTGKIAKVDQKILDQYLEKMIFLSENENKLVDVITQHKDKNASAIYRVMKKQFGNKLGKEEYLDFINKILENKNSN
jgi:hypothetical protein